MLLKEVGLQLYSLHEYTEKDFCGTVEKVAQMGYKGVEFAGYGGLKPEQVVKLLKDNGLTAYGSHIGGLPKTDAELDAEIEMNLAVGSKYLICPWQDMETRDDALRFAEVMNRTADRLRPHGLRLGYHNHDFEFVKMEDGQWSYDVMFAAIPHDNLMPELDTCWCDVATGDAPGFIKKYSGRIPVIHLKDYIKKGEVKNMYKLIGIDEEESEGDTGYFGFRSVGFGQMIWEPILAAGLEAGSKWVIVEQDEHYELDPLECARRSREYLKILGW